MDLSDRFLRELYLDLVQKVIINEIYEDPPLERSLIGRLLVKVGIYTRHEATREFDRRTRELGLDWPSVAHSMIGGKRMSNLRNLLVDVIENQVEGDFIETGVWRGGACIYAKAIMTSYGITDRKVWLADSFSGLPTSDGTKYEADKNDLHSKEEALSVSREEVENNFNAYGLLDENVEFLVGWFKDTLPKAPINKIAVLRLDGDMYESTIDAMEALYHKISPNGYVIVDDYHAVEGCKLAIHDYLDQHCQGESVNIEEIDGTGVFWKKIS
jgi:hypothetical protein